MADNQIDLRDKETRYRVVDQAALSVEVQGAAEDVDTFEAELLDISSGGVRLKVSRSLRDNDNHTVRITSNDLNGPIYVDVRVCWSQLKATGDWWIGCSFHPPIPHDILAGLTSAGVIDRRENRRDPISIDTMAQWELELEQAPVRIIDISKEGICLTSKRSGLPRSRVLLWMDKNSPDTKVTARIRWQIEEEHGFTMGCEVAHESRSALREMLKEKNASAGKNSIWKRLLGRT